MQRIAQVFLVRNRERDSESQRIHATRWAMLSDFNIWISSAISLRLCWLILVTRPIGRLILIVQPTMTAVLMLEMKEADVALALVLSCVPQWESADVERPVGVFGFETLYAARLNKPAGDNARRCLGFLHGFISRQHSSVFGWKASGKLS